MVFRITMEKSKALRRMFMEKRNDGCLQLGTFLIGLIFFSIVITTTLYFFTITVTPVNLAVAICCSSFVCFVSSRNIKKTVLITIVGILILVGTIVVCEHTFDFSWDGNTYHKTMTAFMKNGWNPLKVTFYDYAASNIPSCSVLSQTWLDAYPKGAEIFAACIYTITGNIEGGKCFNILSCIAVCFVSCGFLGETTSLKRGQKIICSILFGLNPVVFSQFFTYYIDGLLWQFFLLCIFCLMYLTLCENGRLITYCYYILFISIVVGLNLKFSSLIYFGVPCMVFFVYWVIKKRKELKKTDVKRRIMSRFYILALSAITGTCYAGATSYIINLLRHKNPVYTMMGEGSTDLITVQLPTVYQNMNNISRFICSLFSKTNGSKTIEQVEWKIPFTIYQSEFIPAQSCDVRTAGWGILFSGIFIISMVIVIFVLIRYRKIKKDVCQVIYLLFGIMLGEVIFVPGLCWARYFGALFYVPVVAIIYLFLDYNKRVKKTDNIIAIGLIVLLCTNMIPNIVFSNKMLTDKYSMIENELEQFKNITEENDVVVGYNSRGRFSGRIFTLEDMGITDYTFGEVDENEVTGDIFPNYGLVYKIVE